jgi:hypothetical protein
MNDVIRVSRHIYSNDVRVIVIEHERDDPRAPRSRLSTSIYVPLRLLEKLIADLKEKL